MTQVANVDLSLSMMKSLSKALNEWEFLTRSRAEDAGRVYNLMESHLNDLTDRRLGALRTLSLSKPEATLVHDALQTLILEGSSQSVKEDALVADMGVMEVLEKFDRVSLDDPSHDYIPTRIKKRSSAAASAPRMGG